MGETFVLTGPQALTDAEIVDKISSALGHAVARAELAPDPLAAVMKSQGLPPQFAEDLACLVKEAAAGDQATTTTAVRDITGRPARTFDDFLTANLQSLRATVPHTGHLGPLV